MGKKFKTRPPRAQKIKTKGRRYSRVDPKEVAKALGAEPTGVSVEGGSPPALYALRSAVASRLSSSGGRPGLKGTTRRQKIPLTDADWARLEALAESLGDEAYRPSPSQVASILLHRALENLATDPDLEPEADIKTGRHE